MVVGREMSCDSKRPYIPSLQSLRAIAFLDIFLSHCELIPTATIGVSLFLLLSGFLMAYQYQSRETGETGVLASARFAYRKIGKLYPLHITAMLFVASVQVLKLLKNGIKAGLLGHNIICILLNALCLQSWIPSRKVYFSYNAVSWYLSTIIFSYFMFNILWKRICDKNKTAIISTAVVAISIMIIVSVVFQFLVLGGLFPADVFHWVTYINPLYRFGDFLIGLLLGLSLAKNPQISIRTLERWKCTLLEIIVIFFIAVTIFLYSKDMIPAFIKFSLVWMPISTITIVLLSIGTGGVKQALAESKVFVFLGNISGECFLIHLIIVRILQRLTHNKSLVAIFALMFTIMISITWRKGIRKNEERKRHYRRQ